MSLKIETDAVTEVLLDRWYAVADRSFTLDSYEYLWSPNEKSRSNGDFELLHDGGGSGVCATGFAFNLKDDDGAETRIPGPLTAILAVKCASGRPVGRKVGHLGIRVT